MGLPSVSVIGSGNVGWHMAWALHEAGCKVSEVFSRDKEAAIRSADRIPGCIATNSLDFSQSASGFFILSVPDDKIVSVVSEARLPERAVLVHTSGSAPMDLLSGFSHFGVLYPLQTFSKRRVVDFSSIPLLIEANGEYAAEQITRIGTCLSANVFVLNSEERARIHLAAVFANNFINHLLAIMDQILDNDSQKFAMMKSLIRETVDKAFTMGPLAAQTGPAVRGDLGTVSRHLESLGDASQAERVYRVMTESILATRGK